MLLTNEMRILIRGNNITHYNSIGYKCIINEEIIVKTSDVSKGSDRIIKYSCDICGDIHEASVYDYFRKIGRVDYCNKCKHIKSKNTVIKEYGVGNVMNVPEYKMKQKASVLLKYGVDNAQKSDEVKEKTRRTNILKYGFPCVLKNEEIKNKIKNTNIERYGTEFAASSEIIRKKISKTVFEKYGVENVMQVPEFKKNFINSCNDIYGTPYPISLAEIKEKRKITCLARYGCEHVMQSKVVMEKSRRSLYVSGGTPSSSQQRYVCALYGAKLNYPIGTFSLDMFFENNNIYVEWDGGGHEYSVLCGKISKYDFDKKQMNRCSYLERIGLKEIRIISTHDFVPEDEVLINMKSFAFHKIIDENYNHITFNIDNSVVKYGVVEERYNFINHL